MTYSGEIRDDNAMEKYKIDQTRLVTNHAITLVTKIGEWFGAKNSWGDTRLLWIHQDNLIPDRCFGVSDVDADEEERFSGGKRPTKKYKRKSRQLKSKKTRQRKSRRHRHK